MQMVYILIDQEFPIWLISIRKMLNQQETLKKIDNFFFNSFYKLFLMSIYSGFATR